MAKVRSKFSDILTGWSKSLFNWMSRHEEHSALIRRLKLPVLGLFVALIGLFSTASICIINCYVPLELEPHISDTSIEPNPTAGADSVEVKTRAYFEDERAENEEVLIDSAACFVEGDTALMFPDDGEWGPYGTEESLSAKLYVGDIEPGTTKVYIEVYNNHDDYNWDADEGFDLEITEE